MYAFMYFSFDYDFDGGRSDLLFLPLLVSAVVDVFGMRPRGSRVWGIGTAAFNGRVIIASPPICSHPVL